MEVYMDRALELAQEALDAQEVPVGCVFVRNDEIIAEDRNRVNETKNPTKHAEINCIDRIVQTCTDQNVLIWDYMKDVSVIVNVEPCIMCAFALYELRVKTVVYGCANDRFGGTTVIDVGKLSDYQYEIIGNVKSEEAMGLLKNFYKGSNPQTVGLRKNKCENSK